MIPTIRLQTCPLTLPRIQYRGREQRIILLAHLTSQQWTALDWKVLCGALESHTSLKADLTALSHFRAVFDAVSTSDASVAGGQCLLLFPTFEDVSLQFVRVMNAFAEMEEPVCLL